MGPVRNVCNTSHISVSSWQACVATNPPHCLACNASQTKLPALFTYPVSAASACFGRIVRCQHDSSEARARLSYKYHFVARRSLSCVGSSEQELPLPFASFGIGRSAHCKLLHESENLRRLHLHARVRARARASSQGAHANDFRRRLHERGLCMCSFHWSEASGRMPAAAPLARARRHQAARRLQEEQKNAPVKTCSEQVDNSKSLDHGFTQHPLSLPMLLKTPMLVFKLQSGQARCKDTKPFLRPFAHATATNRTPWCTWNRCFSSPQIPLREPQ